MARANPFDNLSDFKTEPTAKPVEKAQIEQIAAEQGFPSRKAAPAASAKPVRKTRRYTTGRNQQFNIRASAETIERFTNLADKLNIPLGALLERAVSILEQDQGAR